MADYVLAADIGGTKVAAACIARSGKITHRCEAPTPAEGGGAVVDLVVRLLRQLPQEKACSIAVDVPGLAWPDGSVWAPNIRGWKRCPLGRILRRRFKLPVLVESDRNAFVVGESWRGAARHCSDVVFLIVGTGIGAGILSGGQLLRGHGELAGAVGWLAVGDAFLPRYEFTGCLEAHAAGPAIASAASRVLHRRVSAREVALMARGGNKAAREILQEAGRHLGRALANLVSTLNPEIIVIGGGVAEAGDLLLGPAREEMNRWAQPLAAKQVRVVRSRLQANAGLLGAARLAWDRYHL